MASQSPQPTEPPREERKRIPWIARYTLIIVLIVAIIAIAYFLPYVFRPLLPTGDCRAPTVGLSATPSFNGYRIDVLGVTEHKNLGLYGVSVIKDNLSWSSGLEILSDGELIIGPAGEHLNFTDMNGDGYLSRWDIFTLDSLTSGSQYEVVLFFTDCDHEITREIIIAP
ncbi:MAG: hypothetical protein KAW39_07780 [Thermoplasmata archaeon]|nr:hypothetical protein [Thermoplasmata archaeon]